MVVIPIASASITGSLTLNVHEAVLLPSVVVTVTVAVPAPTAVTTPLLTVTTLVSFELQLTDLSVAVSGVTVADNAYVSPVNISCEVAFKDTPVTAVDAAGGVISNSSEMISILPLIKLTLAAYDFTSFV